MRQLLQRFLRRYARGEARALAPYVVGKRLLDLGSGEGWVGAALRELAPIRDCGADVAPFRLVPGRYVVYDGARLPFRDRTFDTTLISFALHHCDAPETVLAEAVRVTRIRLLVVESLYLPRSERFWLDLLDARLNRHRHGGRMNAPGAFKSPEAWRTLFASHGLAVVGTEWIGSRLEHLVHHPLLFVMDKSVFAA